MMASSHAPRAAGFPPWLVEAALDAGDPLHSAPLVLGLSGVQGSGKSTLAAQIDALAQGRGLRVAVLSLDDFYLPGSRRRALAYDVHPLLATRGPPGTHDLPLALEVMDRLRAGDPVRLPRFDKLDDERLPESRWPRVESRVDLILLEGWMLGVPAQRESELAEPVNELERTQDPDATWRTWCNRALAEEYPALWREIDTLWVLQAPRFEVVPAWRWEQEQSLRAGARSRPGMERDELERFVQLFERVSRHALQVLPALAQRIVALDELRQPVRRAGLGPAP